MEYPPNDSSTAITEKGSQSRTTFPQGIENVRTATIQREVEHSVKIAAQNGGDRSINLGGTRSKKFIPIGIPIWGIQTSVTKRSLMGFKFSHDKTTTIVRPGFNQLKTRSIKNNRDTEMNRARGRQTKVTRR